MEIMVCSYFWKTNAHSGFRTKIFQHSIRLLNHIAETFRSSLSTLLNSVFEARPNFTWIIFYPGTVTEKHEDDSDDMYMAQRRLSSILMMRFEYGLSCLFHMQEMGVILELLWGIVGNWGHRKLFSLSRKQERSICKTFWICQDFEAHQIFPRSSGCCEHTFIGWKIHGHHSLYNWHRSICLCR